MGSLESLAGISVVIPAAGVGKRMLTKGLPKQYMTLLGKSILQITLETILSLKPDRVILVVSPRDNRYKFIDIVGACDVVVGGDERAISVLNGLSKLDVNNRDFVMVHDAVRPCVRTNDILLLADAVKDHDIGGFLAVPVSQSLKKVSGVKVETIDREGVWQAQTPQIFRYQFLFDALSKAIERKLKLVDESQAIEFLGLQPLVLKGHLDNIKITEQDDLELARYYFEKITCE